MEGHPAVAVLVRNIKDYIRKAKREGTCGMSKTNLRQVVSTKDVNLPPHHFDAAFAEAVAQVKVKGFNIYD